MPYMIGFALALGDSNDLYTRFLIDVEMAPCMMTSRIKQAISTVQLFVQRCLMNLEPDVSFSFDAVNEWKWRKNYRVWEANRKVFLYPENWIEPELRDDKSSFFKDLENELLQKRLAVFEKYPWLMESEVMLGGSTAGSIFNTAKGAMGMLKRAQGARRTTTTQTTKYGPQGEYRGGAERKLGEKSSIRFGLYYDESPQPDHSVSPLLPDANRWGYSLGYGHRTKKIDIDAYLLYVDFEERTTLVSQDNFNGTYKTDVWIVGASVGF